jgi:hypothetical protein
MRSEMALLIRLFSVAGGCFYQLMTAEARGEVTEETLTGDTLIENLVSTISWRAVAVISPP